MIRHTSMERLANMVRKTMSRHGKRRLDLQSALAELLNTQANTDDIANLSRVTTFMTGFGAEFNGLLRGIIRL